MKTYIQKDNLPNEATDLKVEVSYNLGGMNYFTGKAEGRGYYLSVVPVKRKKEKFGEREYWTESFVAFSGTKMLILPTQRKSDKAYKKAIELAKEKQEELINYVLGK